MTQPRPAGLASATIRTKKHSPNTPMAHELAIRRVRQSWEATAPTITNTAGATMRLRP